MVKSAPASNGSVVWKILQIKFENYFTKYMKHSVNKEYWVSFVKHEKNAFLCKSLKLVSIEADNLCKKCV